MGGRSAIRIIILSAQNTCECYVIIDTGKREIGNGVVHVMLYIAFAVEPRKLSDFRLAG